MNERSPQRVIAIGDLNASYEVLLRILRGLRVVDKDLRWRARATHLIQLGDLFNRGGGARDALRLLLQLQEQAPAKGSKVTVLLGNHEVMTALGNEAYCNEEEYLAFATARERKAWPGRVRAAMMALYREHPAGGPIMPLQPRLEAWKAAHAPGQKAMRKALNPRAPLGRALRELPLLAIDSEMVFVHAGITPRWARLGAEGLNASAAEAMRRAPPFYGDLDKQGLLRSTEGPLWNRSLAKSESARSRVQLSRSLAHLGAKRMVIGHTMTGAIKGGRNGQIRLRQGGRLVCIDVGLGRQPEYCAALVVAKGRGEEWTPRGRRRLWGR